MTCLKGFKVGRQVVQHEVIRQKASGAMQQRIIQTGEAPQILSLRAQMRAQKPFD